jgi:excisionase family DNA binding protein
VSIVVTVELNGVPVPVTLSDDALAAIAAALPTAPAPEPSPFLTIPEAAAHLRCKRQRIDDLLSQRRLSRVKDGTRTLVRRDELLAYIDRETNGRA